MRVQVTTERGEFICSPESVPQIIREYGGDAVVTISGPGGAPLSHPRDRVLEQEWTSR